MWPLRGERVAARVGDVDSDLHGDPEPQRLVRRRFFVEYNFSRPALHDLYPVAGRILRWEQRERRAGTHADRINVSVVDETRINIRFDLGLLSDANVGELGLFEVRARV